MKDIINVEIQATFEISKKDFQEYLLDTYVCTVKEWRFPLSTVFKNCILMKLEDYFEAYNIDDENVSNMNEIMTTFEKWTNEYFEKINFNE